MKIDINKYRSSKEIVQRWYLTKGNDDLNQAIPTAACFTGIPCLVIIFYLADILGWDDFLVDRANSLIDFYGYTEILNKPDGCPKEIKI